MKFVDDDDDDDDDDDGMWLGTFVTVQTVRIARYMFTYLQKNNTIVSMIFQRRNTLSVQNSVTVVYAMDPRRSLSYYFVTWRFLRRLGLGRVRIRA